MKNTKILWMIEVLLSMIFIVSLILLFYYIVDIININNLIKSDPDTYKPFLSATIPEFQCIFFGCVACLSVVCIVGVAISLFKMYDKKSEDAVVEWVCPKCGKPIYNDDAGMCQNCGYIVEENENGLSENENSENNAQ